MHLVLIRKTVALFPNASNQHLEQYTTTEDERASRVTVRLGLRSFRCTACRRSKIDKLHLSIILERKERKKDNGKMPSTIRLVRHHVVDTNLLSPNANKPINSFSLELTLQLLPLARLNQHGQAPPGSMCECVLKPIFRYAFFKS